MSADERVRIAVLTDFHAYASRPGDKATPPSWLDLAKNQADPGQNPFAGLLQAIADDPKMRADAVICCGDLGDKADPAGQQYVWSEVERVRIALGARITLGAAGNHDVDSRHVHNGFDAKGHVQGLQPGFPVEDNRGWLEYWAQNFTIVDFEGVRFVLLNSAAYHGAYKDGEAPEYLHGRVSDRTITRMIAQLKIEGPAAANVLVCHHHPYKNDKVATGDYSQMKNGDKLINDMVDASVGPWLVIHGHKHDGRLFYAQGTNAFPTVFSAASFSAMPYADQVGRMFNEFYILDLEVPSRVGVTTSLKGTVNTWNWGFGAGWRRPQVGEGMGPRAGFGARVDTGELAEEIATGLRRDHAGKPVQWATVAQRHPKVNHIIPDELALLLKLLVDYHGLRLNRDFELGEVAVVQVP